MHRESFSPNTGDTTRNLPTGIRPYGRSWQRPGVTPGHWPAAPANPNVLGSSWLGEVRGGARPLPGTLSREPQGCIVCSELAGDDGNLGRRSRRTAPATSRQAVRKVIHDYPRHFPEFLPLASSRRRAGWLANECGQPPRYGLAGIQGAASRHDRYGPNPRPPAQIRSLMGHAGRRGHQLPDISSSIALK